MGAIADRSFNMYGTGKNQIDIAKQMRLSGYINPKDQIGIAITSQIPSIFMSLTQKIVDVCGDYNSESSDGELSEAGEDIQNQIKTVLANHKCDSIQDLYALAETKQQEIDKGNAQIAEQEKIYNEQAKIFEENNKKFLALTPIVKNLTTELNSLINEYTNLFNSLTNKTNPNEVAQIEEKLSQMKKEIQSKEKELETKKEQLVEAKTKVTEADERMSKASEGIKTLKENLIKELVGASKNGTDALEKMSNASKEIQKLKETLNKDLETIKTDIATVESLSERLKKLEKRDGKDAIANMSNNDTKDISGLIKDLNEARQTNDPEKRDKAEEKLKKALEKYTKDHKEKDNKTIDLLLEKYDIKWPTGSTKK